MRWWLVVAAIAVSCVNVPEVPPEDPVMIETINVAKLAKAYAANEIAADREYKGRRVRITGTVDSVGKDIVGTPYVVLIEREERGARAQCTFGRGQEDKLARLTQGQRATFSCEVRGVLGWIHAAECR